jgi:hypothetical protein
MRAVVGWAGLVLGLLAVLLSLQFWYVQSLRLSGDEHWGEVILSGYALIGSVPVAILAVVLSLIEIVRRPRPSIPAIAGGVVGLLVILHAVVLMITSVVLHQGP